MYNNSTLTTLEIVLHYTYLGFQISGSGDFIKATEVLSSKTKNALAALRKKLALVKLPPDIANRLFTSFYTYGSGVWGTSLKDDFDYWDKSSIEKVHLQFCKIYLGVNKKASNIACRAEVGRFPAKIDTDTNILKYWMYIDTLEDNTLVKQAFLCRKT